MDFISSGDGSMSPNDVFAAFGAQVVTAGGSALQQVAANYAKAWNPTTQSYQAVSGNTPTGGRPDDGQIIELAESGGIFGWMKEHPYQSIGFSLLGLGLFYGMYKAFFK